MRRIILTIFATSALITLAGCGKVHDPSSVTEATVVEVEPTEEVIVTATDNVDASIIKTEVTEAGYIYTVFVSSNEAYSVLKNDCVKFLDETYKNISDVHQDVKVFVWNLNDVSTTNTCAFIRIESPTILDMKKVFISVFGTTKYQESRRASRD